MGKVGVWWTSWNSCETFHYIGVFPVALGLLGDYLSSFRILLLVSLWFVEGPRYEDDDVPNPVLKGCERGKWNMMPSTHGLRNSMIGARGMSQMSLEHLLR